MISSLDDEQFTSNVLHYRWEGPLPSATDDAVKGLRSKPEIRRQATKYAYGVTRPDVISPVGKATRQLTYTQSGLTAGVGFKGEKGSRCLTIGFPFESITSQRERDKLMRSVLRYLTEN